MGDSETVGHDRDQGHQIAGFSIALQIDQHQYRVLNQKLDILGQEHAEMARKLNQLADGLDQLLAYLAKVQVAKSFQITIKKQGDMNMAGKQSIGKMKLDLSADKKSGSYTLQPVDSIGLGPAPLASTVSVPVVTSSDPTVVTVDPSTDPSGLTGTFQLASPPKAGSVTLSASATDSASGATLASPPSEAINVVPGTAGSFVMNLA